MKRVINCFLFSSKTLVCYAVIIAGLSLAAFGQTKRASITEEEFGKEIKEAWKISEESFPRRETYTNPNKMNVYMEGSNEPLETVLSESKTKEFLAKDKIRYEFKKTTTKGLFINKRVQISSICYDDDGRKWDATKISCDLNTLVPSVPPTREEFFVEKGLIDSKPVKIFRYIRIGKVYADNEPPYIDESLYYIDSAGRFLKREYLTRKGEEKASLNDSVIYEYKVKIAPIVPLSKNKKTKKSR